MSEITQDKAELEAARASSSSYSEVTPKLSSYFTSLEWLSYAVIVAIGVLLRWLELDARPYHHDESQHAMFGKYFFDWPEIQFYKYDPMMHAPLLYNTMRAVYTAFGHTLWSARVPIALLGTAFIFVPLIFRRHFSSTALLALTAAISFSANMVYWSRFLIHDYFVLAALLITFYGVTQASPSRRSFYVLLGIALQFCIKANVYVTLAIIVGYLIYEAAIRHFVTERGDRPLEALFEFLGKYSLLFFTFYAIVAALLHFVISGLVEKSKKWKDLLGNFQEHTAIFLFVVFVFSLVFYYMTFFMARTQGSLLNRTIKNPLQYRRQFFSALAVSLLVYCYVTTSGFRHLSGIIDVVYRESIPYWWNQHNIERIQGPFLFHFYMYSWYEAVFILFLFLHVYTFYRNAGKAAKICGLGIVGLAIFLSLLTLFYTAPAGDKDNWRYVADLAKQDLKGFWGVLFAVWGEFKVKDCFDIFGLVLLLLHPLVVTTVHLVRREYILGFWGYFFTASFFSYSFVGEKVPWLCVYPLAAGFVYLTLFFDDWLKQHPISNYREFPMSRILRIVGIAFLILGTLFVLENIFSLSALVAGQMGQKLRQITRDGSIFSIWRPISEGVSDNLLLFLLGFLFYGLYFTNRWTKFLGAVNLKVFLFVALGLYTIRASILTNFVHAGEASEYISQVHTTKEFHDAALKLRELSLNNLRAEPFTIFADGDPVWPFTWYMIGVNDFKFMASAEEKKNFDYILQTYNENNVDMPEGFEKRRLNLRGWWVPDFSKMTLKKFLVYSLNHFPWSDTGFTYVWVFRNTNKK